MTDQVLNDIDVRVLGALIEKEVTTPENYPLSLNALLSACNQSSNRQPVVSFDESTVLDAITRLRRQSLLRAIQPSDSRVMKYQQLMNEAMALSNREMAVLCVLMLRGPQTVGELRTRTERLSRFDSLADIDATLNALIERTPSPLVVRLPRHAGQKELRYAHLLSGEVQTLEAPTPADASAAPAQRDRIAALEAITSELRGEVADLRRQLEEFRKQFE